MNEQELLKLKTDCELYKSKIDKLEKTTDKQEERIQALERSNAKTDFQFEEIMKTLDKLNNVTIPELTKQIQEIKDKPAKRWDTLVVGILGAIAGGVGTFLVNLLTRG